MELQLEYYSNALSDNKINVGLLLSSDCQQLTTNNTTKSHLCFVVDTSYSMNSLLDGNKMISLNMVTRSNVVCQALIESLQYINAVTKQRNNDTLKVSIIGFSDKSTVLCNKQVITDEKLHELIQTINIKLRPSGRTNIKSAFDAIMDLIDDTTTIFLMTDGYHNSNECKREDVISSCSGIKNQCIGLGIGMPLKYDSDLLIQLCSNVYGVKTAKEALDNIVGVSFGLCSRLLEDIKITFSDTKVITPLKTVSHDNKKSVYIPSISISQIVPISLVLNDHKLPLHINYKRTVDSKVINYTTILDINVMDTTNESNNIKNYCILSSNYKYLFDKKLSKKKHNKSVREIYEQIQKIDIGNSKIKMLWDSLYDRVKSHLDDLERDILQNNNSAYLQLMRMTTEITKTTSEAGVSLKLFRQTSNSISSTVSPMIKNQTNNQSILEHTNIPPPIPLLRTISTGSDKNLCILCFSKNRNILFSDCHHVLYCSDCTYDGLKHMKVLVCPVCRIDNKELIKIKLSSDSKMLCPCNKSTINTCFQPCGHAILCNACLDINDQSAIACPKCNEPVHKKIKFFT